MIFKVVWNERQLFKFSNCKIKEQMIGHSKEKLDYLFGLRISPTDKRRNLHEVSKDIADYQIMQLFGSGSFHWFKVEEIC